MDTATGGYRSSIHLALALVFVSASSAAAAEPAWWTQQKRACGLPAGMAYNDWNGVCNSGGASAPSVPVGNTPAQMMNQMGQDMIMQGVQQLLNPTPKTPEQLEAERQAELARQAAEAARQKRIQDYLAEEARKKRERDDALDAEAKQSLALLPRASGADASLSDDDLLHPKKSASFDLGLNDALQCISRNAGPRCSRVPADQTQACVSDYNAGYAVGEAKVKLALSEADLAGKTDGAKGAPSNGAADPRATEGCRTQWIESYNRGYFEGKHATTP
jgi:hypothetical protein